MIRKEDRRVTRTKADLKNALLALIENEEEFKKISIIDIVKKANYNRTTFYVHYTDKFDLLDDISQDTINGFLLAFREPYQIDKLIEINELPLATIKIFDYVKEHSKLFTILFTNPIFSNFRKDFVEAIEQILMDEIIYLNTSIHQIDKQLFVRSRAYSILGLIQFWIDQNFENTTEYMTEQLLRISNSEPNIIKTILKND